MKTGAIIYVAGEGDCTGIPKDPGTFMKKFGLKADRWEIITHDTGHADIHDAW